VQESTLNIEGYFLNLTIIYQPIKIMTKQHFEFVASLIHAANQGTPASVLAMIAVAKFEEDNPRFDAERFLDACGNPLAPPPEVIDVGA
jgi:hypothetical protein